MRSFAAEMSPPGAAKKDDDNNENVQAITRCFAILSVVSDSGTGLRLSDLARAVDLPRSTAHRIVRSLQHLGIVLISTDGRVRIGPGLIDLARTPQDTVIETAHPFMERLSMEVAETVDLATLNGDNVRFIDQVTGSQRLRAASVIGQEFPAYCTANGKALLAELSVRAREVALPKRLTKQTSNTITSRQELLAELERVRAAGVAFDREEHAEQICAVGTVIRDALGGLGAVTIAAPAERFYGNEDELASALRKTADEIDAALSS